MSPVANPVPLRMARVVPARYAEAPSLGPPGTATAWATAAEDLAGLRTARALAERVTLVDEAGRLLPGPFAVTAFDTPGAGVASPASKTNSGFVRGGKTKGGAREIRHPEYCALESKKRSRRGLLMSQTKRAKRERVLRGAEALEYAEKRLREVRNDPARWETEFLDPHSGERWALDYPQAELHGGGSPRLRRVSSGGT